MIYAGDGIAQTLTPDDTSEVRFVNSRKFYIYKVSKGETLFSVSQKFKIPQEEILEFNPDVKKKGLKNKMRIWVPAYSWLNKTTGVKADTIEVIEDEMQEDFTAGVVTTLELPKVYAPPGGEIDSSVLYEPLDKTITSNLHFVEGILFAASELQKKNIKVRVSIIDAENDSLKLLRKFWKKENSGAQFYLTNESGPVLEWLNNFTIRANKHLLSFGVNTTDNIINNSRGIALIPSSNTQCMLAGKFAAKYFKNSVNIHLVSGSLRENERSDAFDDGWRMEKGAPVIRADYQKNGMIGVTDSLKKGKNNVLFIPSANEDMISTFLNGLRAFTTDYEITVIGIPTWENFETIETDLFDRCNVHIFSAGFIDYDDPGVEAFRKYFRETYNTEPGESAFQGYDAMMIASKKWQQKKRDPEEMAKIDGLFSIYDFEKAPGGQCHQNMRIHVFETGHHENSDLTKKINY